MRRACITWVWALALAAAASPARAEDSCTECHGDAAKAPGHVVDAELLGRSAHGRMGCTECHFDYEAHPHPGEAETVGCVDCHDDQLEAFQADVHGRSGEVACANCHGVHDVFAPVVRESRLHPLNVTRTCGACHFENGDVETMTTAELLKQRYADDTHGESLLESGLVVAPTCVSCHGGHSVFPADDPLSRVHRSQVSETCATCHVGIAEQYAKSVHATVGEGSDGRMPPTCTDCHVPHDIGVRGTDFRAEVTQTCATCHTERGETFHETYHGKSLSLGDGERTATCSDCHGAHEILPASDPRSTIHPDHRTATCAKCHAGAHDEFARYAVHADADDKEGHPGLYAVKAAMTWLLIGTFVLAGLHALLWLIRATLAGDWRRPAHGAEQRYVRRWRPLYSGLHVTMMFAFLILGATGLPVHFSDQAWARGLMRIFGGPPIAAIFHRIAAITLIAVVVVYLGSILMRMLRGEKGLWAGPHTMLPRWKDAQDLGANVRWFLGRGPRPRFDRWTYWEKFDFWAVFWGMAAIGGSGVILWFPEASTRVLPAWMISVALVVHGHEALLAIGFIFSIHVFHANLRPDKFPMDTMFLTGRIPMDEFERERPLEYERAVASGTLEDMIDREPFRHTIRRAYLIGTIALVLGTAFLVMMIASM